jgi:hypothetical protein
MPADPRPDQFDSEQRFRAELSASLAGYARPRGRSVPGEACRPWRARTREQELRCRAT